MRRPLPSTRKSLWRLQARTHCDAIRVEPPVGFTAVLRRDSREVLSTPTEETTPFEEVGISHRYHGFSLHQGTLPFVTLNGIHITFSPALLVLIGSASVASVLSIPSYPENLIIPLALLAVIFSQLGGHLLFGWLASSQAESLILSTTGVIDPGLIFRERVVQGNPQLYETSDGVYLKDNEVPLEDIASQEDHEQEEDSDDEFDPLLLEEITNKIHTIEIAKEARHLLRAPTRALGASSGALCFIVAATTTPFGHYINALPALTNILWWYASYLVITPFLPPHQLNAGFRKQLLQNIYPFILFLFALLFMPKESTSIFFHGALEPVALCVVVVATIFRRLWWTRVLMLARATQEISIERAMIPLSNLLTFVHGDTVRSAQDKALKVTQTVFPVISGNRLVGYLERDALMRARSMSNQQELITECISRLSTRQVSLCDPHMSVEVCFSPRTTFPLFVVEEGEIAGMVTEGTVRDALILQIQDTFASEEDDFDL